MAKEILLYSPIYDYSVEDLINKLEDAIGEDVTLRINSGGGNVFSGWGGVAKIQEHGKVKIKVDGVAASMAAIYCLFVEECECLDVSSFMFHRGSAGSNLNAEEQALVDQKNNQIRAKMKAKFDGDLFKSISGISIDDLFDKEERVSVWLDASQAKKIGLVKKVNKVNPVEMKAMNDIFYRIAAENNPTQNPTDKPIIMNTLAELKEKFPALYALAVAEGKQVNFEAGVAAERDRIGAVMVFAHLDPKAAKEIIASGKPMTQTQLAEFSLKAMSPAALKAMKEDNDAPVVTDPIVEDKNKPNPETVAFAKEIQATFGLGGKKVSKDDVAVVTA